LSKGVALLSVIQSKKHKKRCHPIKVTP
jgi:hypothetical protein